MKRRWMSRMWMAFSLILALVMVPVSGTMADSRIYGSSKLTHNSRYQNDLPEYGIDVSHHQGKIDWKKVKAAGVDFAIIRVAARGTSPNGGRIYDRYAKQNLDGATQYGIPFGVYVYSQALTVKEAQEEADWVLEAIEGYQLQLPVVFDYEYADGGRLKTSLSKTKKTNNCLAFCKKIEAAGYTPMLYANKSFLENSINTAAISQSYPIWLAHYSNKTSYEGAYDYWQYTSKGSVDGIKGYVDMNVRYVEQNLQIESTDEEQITLRWNAHTNAKEYEIYRRENGKNARLLDKLTSETCSYTDTDVQADVLYTYQIRARLEDESYGPYSASVDVCAALLKVPTLKTDNKRADQLTISWKASNLAQGYELWRYDTMKRQYVRKAEFSQGTTSYTDTNLTASTQYRYRLRMFRWNGRKKMYSPYGETYSVKTEAITFSVKKSTFDTVKLQWNRINDVTGYQVQRYQPAKKKYETIRTINASSTTIYTDNSRNASTTYQYRVRTWKKNGKKILYGEWSKAVSVKTKAAVQGKTKARLYVRKNAGTCYSVLKTLSKGKKIKVTGSKGSWYRISVTVRGKKRTGYVSKKYVKL